MEKSSIKITVIQDKKTPNKQASMWNMNKVELNHMPVYVYYSFKYHNNLM